MTSEPIDIITLLEECATIKCDHHGIWEGGAGSLCIAPGRGKSGVRQEDLPIPVLMHSASNSSALKLYFGSRIFQRSLACGIKCTFCENEIHIRTVLCIQAP